MSSTTKFVPVSIRPAKLTLKQKKTQLPRSLLSRAAQKTPVFAQGRLRNQNSRAAQKARATTEARIEKYTEQPCLGHNIFAWNHIKTNQVVYSLHRTLTGNDALPQLTFVGKKSIPPSLRKDHWIPFLHIHFPSPTDGLNAFRMLREFRKRHEFDYPLERIAVTKENPYYATRTPYDPVRKEKFEKFLKARGDHLAGRKMRWVILADQKANAIADVAKVLGLQTQEPQTKKPDSEEPTTKVERKTVLTDARTKKKKVAFFKWEEEEKARIDLLKAALRPVRQKHLQCEAKHKVLLKKFQRLAEEEDKNRALQKKLIKAKTEAEARIISIESNEEKAQTELLELDKRHRLILERQGVCDASEKAKLDRDNAAEATKVVEGEKLRLSDRLLQIAEEIETTDTALADIERTRPNIELLAQGPRRKEREWRIKVLQTETAIAAKLKAIKLERAKIERLTAANLVRRAEKRAESRTESQSENPANVTAESMAAATRESHIKALRKKEEEEASLLREDRASKQGKITLLWASLDDFGFAPSWPKATVHGYLPPLRHNFNDERFGRTLEAEGFPVGEKLLKAKENLLKMQGYAVGEEVRPVNLDQASDAVEVVQGSRDRFGWLKRMVPFWGTK